MRESKDESLFAVRRRAGNAETLTTPSPGDYLTELRDRLCGGSWDHTHLVVCRRVVLLQ